MRNLLSRVKKKTIKNRNRSCISITKELAHLVEQEEEEEEVNEEGFNIKSSAPSHTHGVQPLGNLYLNTSSTNSRDTGLGNLHTLSDELVLDILGFLDSTSLGVLASVSKSFYVFTNHEPLWRNLVLENLLGGFQYKGSWKSTYVSACYPSFDNFAVALGGFKVRDFYSDYLFQSWLCANLEMKPEWLERDNVVRKRGIRLRSLC